MGIVKPMKELAAGVKVTSVFPESISQELARSEPSSVYHLNNTNLPSIYFKNLADNFSG
jgi:hypothetical protein